jgi:hypothetical protein
MNKQITRLSDIHRDIWFEIFAYFYADELFSIFLHVLNEIDSILLNDIRLRLHIRVDYELSTKLLLQVNPTQIISLSIEEMENNQIDIRQMIYLQSVVMKGTNADRWMEHLCQQMILLKEIKKISISLFYNNRGSHLFNLVLRIPQLKQLYFDDISNWEMDYHQMEMIQTEIFSIEKLHLDFYCSFEYIRKILFYLPNIQTLRLKLLRSSDNWNENIQQSLFHQMKKVHLTLCDASFDEIISFLQTMPKISIIKIDGYIWGTNIIAYFQIEKWYQILSFLNNDIKEKKIFVDLDVRQDYSNLSTNNIGVINYDGFQQIGLQITSYTIQGIIIL